MKKALIIGIGGAGTNTVSRLNPDKYYLYLINSDERVLKIKNIKATQISLSALREVKKNKELEQLFVKNLNRNMKDSADVFLVAGLGADYSFEIINYIKKHINKPKHLICFFPFNLEKARQTKASIDMIELIGDFDSILIYDNNYLVKKYPQERMDNAFKKLNQRVEKYIEGMCSGD
jgi:cell division GTPase FtsZ